MIQSLTGTDDRPRVIPQNYRSHSLITTVAPPLLPSKTISPKTISPKTISPSPLTPTHPPPPL